MEPMKISFGFTKTAKRTNIFSSQAKQEVKKVDLVECLEGQSIKVKDAVEEVKQPLVIPLKDDQKNLLDRVRAAKKRDRQEESKKAEEDTRLDSELSVDELAARQLIREAKERLTNGHSTNNSTISVLPLKQEAQSLEGEKEPTLDDYESVPISDYGLAILRGMGWKEGMAIGKDSSKSIAVSVPELRPKGLGLGATKVVQSEMPAKKAVDKDGKELILMKGAFAKVIAGPHKGQYCEVQGFDEEAGRVIIKVHPAGNIVNINELMLSPVTKEEFSKGSKILNNAKYEEYKEISDKKLDSYKVKQESSISRKIKEENNSSDSDGHTSKTERNCRKDERKSQHNPRSSENEDEKRSSKSKEQHKSTSKHRESVSSDREYAKRNSHKKEKSKSRADDRSPSYSSSKYKSHKKHDTDSSDSEYQKKDKTRSNVKQKSKNRRSRSRSRHSSGKKDNTKYLSSDEDSHEKVKKSGKHSKSKNRDRSRSKSGDRHRKNKKHSSRHRDSSESDSGKKERRKKNKCKSRHRRNSSSSSEDRQNRSKR